MVSTPFTYKADKRNLTNGFDETGFKAAVDDVITQIGITANQQAHLRNAIAGMLLLDGNHDHKSGGFNEQVRRLWNYVQSDLLDADGRRIPDANAAAGTTVYLTNNDAFEAVDKEIRRQRARLDTAFYQELAAAGREIIDGHRGDVVTDAILLPSSVAASLQDYGSGASSIGSFDLPPLSDPTTGGGTDEIIPDHIRGVAVLYAALQLEILGLFKVVDRNVEIFMNGQLPVANDLGGNALNHYYWDSPNRMSESARWMQYSRVLGVKGGEVSREVGPNVGFDDSFVRFISALSEYDRQQRVGDLLGNGRGLSVTAEHVRKAGRDLAANCTLYGYGYTQFAAKRLQQHIQTSLNLLKLPDIQQAWGVQSAWQVVERVSAQEFHSSPNVVKYRTMADSGKRILDIVADVAGVWSSLSDRPLFATPQNEVSALLVAVTQAQLRAAGAGAAPSALAGPLPGPTPITIVPDIDPVRQAQLMRHTEYWLAVNGIKDQAIAEGAQPSDTASSPSIPTMDGSGGSNGTNADLAGQIQQMLQQGQTPSPDQLRKMVGV
jgi:hypothetical protein